MRPAKDEVERKELTPDSELRLRDKLQFAIEVPLGYLYGRTTLGTCRMTFPNREVEERLLEGGRRIIYAMWHEMAPHFLYGFLGRGIAMMFSRGMPAEFGARVWVKNGMRVVRGSSSRWSEQRGWRDKGGQEALAQMERLIRESVCSVVLTVDGPRGPARVVKPGLLALARKTGAPILPMHACPRRGFALRTWDRMRFAFPFQKIVYLFAEPLWVPHDADESSLESLRVTLEARMRAHAERTESYWRSVRERTRTARGSHPGGSNRPLT